LAQGDADGIEEELTASVVLDEPAGELGIADTRVLRNRRTEGIDLVLVGHGLGEGAKREVVAGVILVEADELVARVALADAGGAAGDVESTSRGVGHHVVGVDEKDLTRVEVVDGPALVAVLEAVLLRPPPAHDGDEALGREVGAREEVW
jgi:hypothetical protein